jgi:Ca-activated chloride channel family protein
MARILPLILLLASCAQPAPDVGGSRAASPSSPAKPVPGGTETAPTTRVPEGGGRPAEAERAESVRDESVPDRSVRGGAGRDLDWGGRTFLSNDDSMSLASAQRVLWAVAQGVPVDPAELRPHELLNYFTFHADPLPAGDSFGVTASAVRTDDGLTVALAVTGATPARRPLDLTLLLDHSGSMEAEGRMDYLKRGLTRLVEHLRAGDRVDVVLFDDRVETRLAGFQVGRDDLDDLRLAVDELRPRGATNLDAGLQAAYRIARAHPDAKGRDQRIIVVTDAQINSGDVNADRVSEIARACDESDIRLVGVGVGHEFDDHVLQALTEKGKGAYVYLGSEAVVDRVFGAGFDALVHVVAEDVHFALDLPETLAVRRFYGEEMSTAAADVQPVSFHAGTTQLFLEDLAVAAGGTRAADTLALDITWTDPATHKARSQRWTGSVGKLLAADSRNVKKARALMAWTDLVATGGFGDECRAARRTWSTRARAFGGDVETRYLDGLTRAWCPGDRDDAAAIAEVGE